MKSHCSICNKEMDISNDPLSIDCGGDCCGCIGEIEADMGHVPSIEIVRSEFKKGLRKNWMQAPKTRFKKVSGSTIIEIVLEKPSGLAWPNENIEFIIYEQSSNNTESIKSKALLKTQDNGTATYTINSSVDCNNLWFRIIRGDNQWSYPVNVE